MLVRKANAPPKGLGGKNQNAVRITFVTKAEGREEREVWSLRAT